MHPTMKEKSIQNINGISNNDERGRRLGYAHLQDEQDGKSQGRRSNSGGGCQGERPNERSKKSVANRDDGASTSDRPTKKRNVRVKRQLSSKNDGKDKGKRMHKSNHQWRSVYQPWGKEKTMQP